MKATPSSLRPGYLLATILLGCTVGHSALADNYDPSSHELTMSALSVGTVTYTNVVVTIDHVVSGPGGSAPAGTADTYDPATHQLTVPSVTVAGKAYYNVVAVPANLVSIGSVVGADTYANGRLTVPRVTVGGGATYPNVVLTANPADVVRVDGGVPATDGDRYDPADGLLSIAAVEYRGHVYTNVLLKVDTSDIVAVNAVLIGTGGAAGATVNSAYSQAFAASGGSGSYTWTVQAGSLPAGLTLSGNGTLSGTPTTAGISTFTLQAADSASTAHVATQTYNLLVAAAVPATQLSLTATPSTLTVSTAFAGLSYEKSKLSTALFSPGNATLIALFNRLGPGLLRIGGNSVDHTLWNPAGTGKTAYEVSPPDIARLAGFLQASHWQVLYGIEYLNEAASPVAPTDPTLVGEEAVSAMQQLGDSLYGFEIGNEPDLYHDQISGFTYANFQSGWESYREAILSAVAAAKAAGTLPQSATPRFTGPAAAYNQSGYVAPFAAAESADIFLLTRHYYVANGQSSTSTMSLLLTPDPALPPDLSAIAASATAHHISDGYRLAEANSFYNGGAPGVSDGFGTALWAINFLYTNAWAGSSGVNFHGGGSGPGYTPIADNGSAAIGARPEYYGLYLFSQAATGNLVATTLTPASASLYAYAVTSPTGFNVMLVNTSATTDANVAMALPGSVAAASFYALTGPSLTSTSGQLLNGAPINADGSWTPVSGPALPITGGNLQVPVPAGSALLLIAQ